MTDTLIDPEKVFGLLGYKPHPKQQLFHDSTARFRIPTCGRRFGKSVMAAREITKGMFIRDTRYWIVGPQYSLGEKEFRVVHHDFFNKLGLGGVKGMKASYNVEQGNMRIETPWNSIVEVKSAEKADSLVGEALNGVIMSEAALHDKKIWDQFVRPTLTDYRGWGIFPSTPRGHNWYEGMWLLGQDPQFDSYESWRFPSWDNPHVYPEGELDPEILEIKAEVSDFFFQQEYAAEFTAFEGKIYDEFDPTIHVTDLTYNPDHKNYWFMDFGFSDPTVCLDVSIDSQQRVRVWREYSVRQKTSQQHGLDLKSRPNPVGYHVDGRFGDPRGADEAATIGMINGPIVQRVVPWVDGIEAVKRQMKMRDDGTPGLLIDRSCVNLIRSLGNLRTPTVKEGKNARLNHNQHDYDDHEADALRYGCGELFFLGWGGGLSDMYTTKTEAQTFFQYHEKMLHNPGGLARMF